MNEARGGRLFLGKSGPGKKLDLSKLKAELE